MYKKNQLKAKVFKQLSPVVFWLFLSLSILFLCLMLKHSVGNITDIIDKLDTDSYSGEQVEVNYRELIDKWGEWTIIGKDGGSLSIKFVDLKNAFFSGLMGTFVVLSLTCLSVAIIIGKFVFPKLTKYYSDNNQDMVNIATLQTNTEIRKKKDKEDWF